MFKIMPVLTDGPRASYFLCDRLVKSAAESPYFPGINEPEMAYASVSLNAIPVTVGSQ